MKLLSTSDGGADGSSILLVINGSTKRPVIVLEQAPELCATMLSLSNKFEVFVQTKDTEFSVYIVPTHMTTVQYSADLHANFPKRTFVEDAAAVRHVRHHYCFIAAVIHHRAPHAMRNVP